MKVVRGAQYARKVAGGRWRVKGKCGIKGESGGKESVKA